MKRYMTWPRAVLATILLFGLAAYALPTITEGWGRDRMLKALEDGLGRKVEIGQVRLRLLPTPGIAVSDVRIGEDPAIGKEPAAYVNTLVARPGILALLTGRIEVASVRLEDASLNLTRADNGPNGVQWNFSTLAARSAGLTPGTGPSAFPSIYMPGGRINFKFGETKSIFYLVDTDVDISPSSAGGHFLNLRIAGQPARTDRPSRGFGSFIASGQWNSGDHSLELDVKLEKSELSDVLSLFEGRESGLLGKVWGDAHLAGPMSKIGVAGRVNVSDLHGWNQLPPGGSAFPFTIGGVVNAAGQVIELDASADGKPSPLGAHYHAADYLGRPRWNAVVNLDGIPVAPLAGIARNFGVAIPQDLTTSGSARGQIGYANDGRGLSGIVRVFDASLAAKDSPSLKIAQADVKFEGTSIGLSPTSIVNDAGESAAVEGSYDTATGEFHAALTSEGMAIASLRRQVSVAGAPILGLATAGVWSGSLRYASGVSGDSGPEVGGWTGEVHLKDADISFEAFAQPVHVIEADATIDAAGAEVKKVRMTIGGIAAQGEYRYEIGATHPHRFRMLVPAATGEDLEAALTPALKRASFLTYAFNFGRVPEPDWLREMHADGTIQVTSLTLGGTRISNVKTTLVWDDLDVRLIGLTGKVSGAAFAGDAVVHLAGRQPRYELNGSLAGFAWQGGTLTANGELATSGMGLDLLGNLHANGTLTGRKLEIGAPGVWDNLEAKFEFSVAGAMPKLKLTALTIQSGGAKWTGSADTQDSGQVAVKVADGARHMEASGALLRGEALKVTP